MKALEINHFTKRYGKFVAVDNITFDIDKGEFFGFLGPNGAGKSSTIHCITGISKYTEGQIKVMGVDVNKNYQEARKKIGLSPQEFNIDIFQTIEKTLWYNAGFYGVPTSKREKKIDEMLKVFELEKHRKKPFQALSGGLKRRVMLARAMMHDPELLILDEPTAGVDVELRHELWKYLRRINEEGKSILLTSHYLEEVELLCNQVAIINNGRIIANKEKHEYLKNGNTLEKTYLELTKEGNERKND